MLANTLALSFAAMLLYVGATFEVALLHLNKSFAGKPRFFVFALMAVGLHAFILHQNVITQAGLNFGFFNAFSLITWVIALILVVTVFVKPVDNLALVLFPAAACGLAMAEYFNTVLLIPDDKGTGFQIHLISSILAYSLLCLSAFQAVFLAMQDYQLRHKHPLRAIHFLPPLQVMEELLMQSVGAGFFLLSISLFSGAPFLENMLEQKVAHHTVLSILAWLIFATLLWGRWRYGWRGRKVVKRTLLGFFILMLAYFGSKFVLEIIKG